MKYGGTPLKAESTAAGAAHSHGKNLAGSANAPRSSSSDSTIRLASAANSTAFRPNVANSSSNALRRTVVEAGNALRSASNSSMRCELSVS